MPKMKIIIVGCSKVGETLAAQLGRESNNVTVIDLNSEKINDITSKYDVMGVVGNGATHTTLVEAGIDRADLLIAVTDSDELNLLCCLIAKKTGRCRVIARVTSPEYNRDVSYLKDELGLEMIINPQYAAAEEIERILRFPAATKIETFAKGKVELITFKLAEDSVLVGMSVKDTVTKLKCDVLVCTVERDGEAYIPNGDFEFRAKDVITIISSKRKAYNFFKKIDSVTHGVKSVILVGIGALTHYLCDMLEGTGMDIKVIEGDYSACDDLASSFKDVTVINGDEADQKLLLEEGASRCDAFVALTAHDEENIILSLFAKNFEKTKVITKITRTEYADIINHLDLDTAIYPNHITSDTIVRYVRAMRNVLGSNVETMYNIIQDKVEASEFYVREGSPVIGIPIADMRFKKDVLIATITRGRTVIVPRGSDVIAKGDSVIVVSKHTALRDISDIIETKAESNRK